MKVLDKKVVIAIPVDIPFNGDTLKVCFMEIDMDEMLSGVSMESDENDATFCNIYTQTVWHSVILSLVDLLLRIIFLMP